MKNKSPTVLERFRDSWVEYSHAAYVTIVVGGAFFATAPEKADWAHKIALLAIASYVLVLLFFLFWFIHAYARKARYAESMRLVHSAIHDVRDIAGYLERCYAKKDKFSRYVVHGALQRSLDAMARAYSMVTGANCRACIKVIGGSSPEDAYVKTVCRDAVSALACAERDLVEGGRHLVTKNTDFSYLVYGKRNAYLNNDIDGTAGYINSSQESYGGTLPYKAVIVLPIRKSYSLTGRVEEPKPPAVVGFLCIDSYSRFCFTEKYDVQMGAIVADALCPILEWWHRLERISQRTTK